MRTVLSSLFALSLLLVAAAAAADDIDSVQVLSAKETERHAVAAASDQAPTVLEQIQAARVAIAEGDLPGAEASLATAADHLDEIRALNPSVSVQQAIAEANEAIGAEDPDAALVALTPVASNLEVKDDYSDAVEHLRIETSHDKHVTRGRESIMKAMDALKVKNVEYARVELEKAREVATYTEIDLPVLVLIEEVKTARGALADGHPEVADQHLAAAQTRAETVVQASQKAAAEVHIDKEAPPVD